MTYTLWSHGELLGESALDYVRVFPEVRMGDLEPTTRGLTLIGRLTQTREDSYRSARRVTNPGVDASEDSETSFYADAKAFNDQYNALALELHAADGTVIPTEDIHIVDTEALLSRDRELKDVSDDDDLDEGLDAEADAAAAELLAAWEEDHPAWLQQGPKRPPARFQISVTLINEWAIP
jgi:hypothetical protein